MDILEILTELQKIAEREAWIVPGEMRCEKPRFHPGNEEEEISTFETLFNRQLPMDYRQFLRKCSGFVGMDFWNGYDLFSLRQVRDYLKLDTNANPPYPQIFIQNGVSIPVITIGGDGSGNLFFMMCHSTETACWRLFHEVWVPQAFDCPELTAQGIIDLSRAKLGKYGVWKLSDDFTGLLDRIRQDWGAFLAQDTKWEYISG